MIPEENEAVREAMRRRRVREALKEPVQEEEITWRWEDCILMRRRSNWIWLSFIPGLLAVPLWWDDVPLPNFGSPQGPPRVIPWDNPGFVLPNLALVLWLAYCSIRLAQTRRERSVLGDIWRSIALFLLFAAVNWVIFAGLFFASCTVMLKLGGP